MSKRRLPEHIPGTMRAWQRRKRAELRAVLKAMERFQLGCAYTPARDWGVVMRAVETNIEQCSPRKWK